jgi:cytochrome c oxidase subunit 2
MFNINKALGIVPNAAEHGYLVDHMLEFCHWFMAALFVGWSIYFLYTIVRFHKSRNPKADYHGVQSKASAHLEFSVVLVEAVLLLGFGLPLWGKRVNGDQFPADTEAVRVHAIAEQFAWNFVYPGADGVFGRRHESLISGANPTGLDANDPAGKDDIISKNELHLQNKKPTVVEVTSKDVIHGFAVAHFRMSQDAIPGSKIPVWFRPITTGEFELICSQLCGAGHFAMRALIKVHEKPDFEAWVKETTDLQHPPTAPAAAAAATPVAPPAA